MSDLSDIPSHPTIIDLLSHWRGASPGKTAFTFLKDKGQRDAELTFAEIHDAVAARAADLVARDMQGQRVIIVLPSGLDYIVGFLACLAAGAIAVPLYPPSTKRDWSRLTSVVNDCTPAAVMLDRKVAHHCGGALEEIFQRQSYQSILLDEPTSAQSPALRDASTGVPEVALRRIDPSSIAFLQYTSGSTGDPKGVMVTHENIIHNARQQAVAMRDDFNAIHVGWLPFYHDMGQIGVILQALSVGAHAVLMAPLSFLRDPVSWLRAISRYSGTISGGPNFAFDLCVDKISDAQCKDLDLSSWRVAFNGSEPIKASTLERFSSRFAPVGFRSTAFFPCYGLAEATLYVAGGVALPETHSLSLDRAQLSTHRAVPAAKDVTSDNVVRIVSVYEPAGELTTLIVDPETWTVRPEGVVGEIWLKGKNVARGYWKRPVETAETFQAYLSNTGEGPFLRTGDLGFFRNGRLYITGRIKEIIIVNGANYYPQDIEETIQSLGDPFRVHGGAAFALPGESLAIVQGLNRGKLAPEELQSEIARVRRVVFETYGIAPTFVGFVPPVEINKTSSGKIQRDLIRRKLTTGELSLITSWTAPAGAPPAITPPPTSPEALALIAWLRDYISRRVSSSLIDERRSIPPYIVLDMGNRGLLGMLAPRSAGGLGLNTTDFLRVLEVLAARDLTLALFVGLNNALGIRPIVVYGSAEVKAKFLANLASGRELAAFALTEPGAGSNPGAISATARQMPDGSYRVSGTKYWSGSAAWSGVINVFAKTLDAQGQLTGFTGFAIPQDSPGVQQGPEALTMGMRGMIQNTVILEEVPVQPSQVLGVPDQGMAVAQDTLCYGRLAIAAVCLGAAKNCYQLMFRYAGRREISTGSLIDNPHTRAVLTDTMHAIEGLNRLISQVAAETDAGVDVTPEILAACKCLATEWLWLTVDRTMQIAGGRGYIETNLIPQIFRDARIFRIFEGPTEALHHFIGASAVRRPKTLRAYFASRMDPAAVAEHFDAALDQSNSQPPVGGDAGAMHWQYSAIGAYMTELVLHTVRSGSNAPLQDWLDKRLVDARRALDTALLSMSDLAAVSQLAAFNGALTAETGIDWRSAPQPLTACDPFLAPEAQLPPPKDLPGDVAFAEPIAVGSAATAFADPAHVRAPKISPLTDQLGDFERFITEWIADRCGLSPDAVHPDIEFATLGLGSVDSVDLSTRLSDRFTLELNPTVLWSHPNIRELVSFVRSKSIEPRHTDLRPQTRRQHNGVGESLC
jgi:acyl-CoA synthetase (AMP-forming)/AMP-acid ligase II/alkylation response protein AidB-like acyl-CoA dehydrogenase/acyl carrier protein